MQTGDIVEQLDLGVRALLIDTHYWDDSGSVEGGDDAAAAAVIEAALADDEPQPGTWLCHGFCGLGATDFESALSEIKLWMDANPREVVMLGIQDEISTQDTVEAFEASGLLDIVHRHEPSSPWPTLEELIDLDERVLVYAENEGEPSSWYQNAWEETITDTPFKFALKSEFSCDANRGQPENPLFLINHWLTTGVPVREAAEAVNEIDELRSRVDQCREARGREPNIIAVDFVEVGDLITFVDELNGVDVPE
ncbi:hypothetical protein [Ilumatobacter sp.]|uniref:hypothetical protein n=1 Tax=Ilumatobacter sp. TaxID=1967498 RepID=UPI003AF435DE